MMAGKADFLGLAADAAFRKSITTAGVPEAVLFSDVVTKINRKEKGQERVFVVTSAAAYNLGKGNKIKRRIAVTAITKITSSAISDEFVVHVPSEYDYRITAIRKLEAIEAIQVALVALGHARIPVADTESVQLKDVTLTRVLSGLFGRRSSGVAAPPSPTADSASGGAGAGAGSPSSARSSTVSISSRESRDSSGSATTFTSSLEEDEEETNSSSSGGGGRERSARRATAAPTAPPSPHAPAPAAHGSLAAGPPSPMMSAQVGELMSITEEDEESD